MYGTFPECKGRDNVCFHIFDLHPRTTDQFKRTPMLDRDDSEY